MKRLHEVAPGVFVATSRRDMTTSTVLVDSVTNEAVVIDPAWDPDELDALAADLVAARLKVVAGVATHVHYDHLLWHPALGDVARWSSQATFDAVRRHRAALLDALGPDWPAPLAAVFARVQALPDVAIVPWSGPPITWIRHDAHVPGHVALWIPDRRVLVAGDMLSDVEIPLPDENDLALEAYRAGLEMLAPYAMDAELVIPGHGRPTADGRGRLDADRRYLDALAAGSPLDDSRLANPGMADAHRRNCALARPTTGC
ncbi:MAG: MBL fold metallo-hydrolase [Acidimicrobiales bacterium]